MSILIHGIDSPAIEPFTVSFFKDGTIRHYPSGQVIGRYENTELTLEDAATIERFRENTFSTWSYAHMVSQAERDGRIIVLPCKVGDTVFWVDRGIRESTIVECTVDEFSVDKYGPMAVLNRVKPRRQRMCAFYLETFGKNIFLTREEAEKKR